MQYITFSFFRSFKNYSSKDPFFYFLILKRFHIEKLSKIVNFLMFFSIFFAFNLLQIRHNFLIDFYVTGLINLRSHNYNYNALILFNYIVNFLSQV